MNEDLEEENTTEDCECNHEWEFQDDSFDHEFGTEVIRYYVCANCGETASLDDFDRSDD